MTTNIPRWLAVGTGLIAVPVPSTGPDVFCKLFDAEDAIAAATAPLLAQIERLKQEAQIHAQEARTANATIAEIYRVCSGGTGEPGNWNGAEPVRARIAELESQLAAASSALEKYDRMMLDMLADEQPSKDAFRYRHIRNNECDDLIQSDSRGVFLPQGEALDTRVDAAIARTKEQP